MGSPTPRCSTELSVTIERFDVVPAQGTKKMVFPAAIREKSQRGVALSWDVQVVSAKSVVIRQPCTELRSKTASCRTFLSVQHFCAGNLEFFLALNTNI